MRVTEHDILLKLNYHHRKNNMQSNYLKVGLLNLKHTYIFDNIQYNFNSI